MEKHRDFTAWAVRNGVHVDGIAPYGFPGRGLGIIAKKRLEAQQLLLSVPSSALRTAKTVPKSISKKLGDITVHGLLAVDLSLDSSPTMAPWTAVLPTNTDFMEIMPLMWDAALQDLLPAASKELLDNQQKKLNADWTTASRAFPKLMQDTFLYNWLIVNTRTFYWIAPGTRKIPARDDCMALNPFADYFNHADEGCLVEYGPEGFSICTDRVYEKHEEVYISYGSHSSDFLLAEYGFVPLTNKWDEIKLDEFILQQLSTGQRDDLEEVGYLGNYILDQDTTVCHRTQVALRLLCLPLKAWVRFVNGEDDGQKDQIKVNRLLCETLNIYQKHAEDILKQLPSVAVGSAGQKQTLTRRWVQIRDLLRVSIGKFEL